MGELTDLESQRGPSDKERAEHIRNLLCQLNACVIAAKAAGLMVEFKEPHTIGQPYWIGLKGLKITREL